MQVQRKADTMSIAVEDLRRRGVRLTPQRRLILDAITHSGGHVTAEQIHERVCTVYPEMSISTVYRNLERLVELRLVAVTDLGAGSVCYETIGATRHHHLICHRCGTMFSLRDDCIAQLRARILAEYDFAVDSDHLALWGLCPTCRKTAA
jgi:Fur family ferric uptake transcriptional regulator